MRFRHILSVVVSMLSVLSIDLFGDDLVPDAKLEGAVRSTIVKPTGDLTPADMQGIFVLQADNLEIVDLSGLEHATNLIQCSLNGNPIVDLGPLSGLASIQILSLRDCSIVDITPLTGMSGLTFLDLGDNQIVNIDSISTLGASFLNTLLLGGNQISNINALTSLPVSFIRRVDLIGNNITDISPLEGLVELTSLDLHTNRIVDITPLAGLAKLNTLSLSDNKILVLDTIASLENLTRLSVANNRISDPFVVGELDSLEHLSIQGNLFDVGDGSPADQFFESLAFDGLDVDYTPQNYNETDNDGNEIFDWWEDGFFGGAANVAEDTDGDGRSNGDEFKLGTDPLNNKSTFNARATINGSNASIEVIGAGGRRYQLQSSPDLVTWTNAGAPFTVFARRTSVPIDIPSSDEPLFYRIVLL